MTYTASFYKLGLYNDLDLKLLTTAGLIAAPFLGLIFKLLGSESVDPQKMH